MILRDSSSVLPLHPQWVLVVLGNSGWAVRQLRFVNAVPARTNSVQHLSGWASFDRRVSVWLFQKSVQMGSVQARPVQMKSAQIGCQAELGLYTKEGIWKREKSK